jgi:hypothetical protein
MVIELPWWGGLTLAFIFWIIGSGATANTPHGTVKNPAPPL